MKILMLFIDQLRPSLLEKTELQKWFEIFGGTQYTNCHTPCPNTTRSLAALFSGELPKFNGCDRPIKLPQYFMNDAVEDIFSVFRKNNYKIDLFHSLNEIDAGIFPISTGSGPEVCLHDDIYKFRRELSLSENQLIWVGTNIHHFWMNYFAYRKSSVPHILERTRAFLEEFFRLFCEDLFDHIFIFSDHGFLLSEESKNLKNYLSPKRTNIFMLHKARPFKGFTVDNKLCSILGLNATLKDIIGELGNFEAPLCDFREPQYLTVEDPLRYSPSVNNKNSMWSVMNKEFVFLISSSGEEHFSSINQNINKLTSIEASKHILREFTDFDEKSLLTEGEIRREKAAVERYKKMSDQARMKYQKMTTKTWW